MSSPGAADRQQGKRMYEGLNLVPVFAPARNWKRYFARLISKYVAGDVLEVGAADGATTPYVWTERVKSWLCLDPDPELSQQARSRLLENPSLRATAHIGTISDLLPSDLYDTILYLDVLEHISDDVGETRLALDHLRPSGHLIVLAPAHESLFTPFDAAVGHKRRYSLRQLTETVDRRASLVEARYLDSAGMLASLANRRLLHSATPSHAQVQLWDRVLIRVSRILDPLFAYRIGKSVLVVWRMRQPDATTAQSRV